MNASAEIGRRAAAFIDRDGVINVEHNYVHRIEDFELIDGVAEGLQALAAAGYDLIVITNQAGIARGFYTEADMERLHAHMRSELVARGVRIDAIYHCPHHPQGTVAAYAVSCDCRKPAPGMLLQAARERGIDLSQSVLVGDKISDIEAGRAAGVMLAVLVRSGHAFDAKAEQAADLVADDLRAAARAITEQGARP